MPAVQLEDLLPSDAVRAGAAQFDLKAVPLRPLRASVRVRLPAAAGGVLAASFFMGLYWRTFYQRDRAGLLVLSFGPWPFVGLLLAELMRRGVGPSVTQVAPLRCASSRERAR